MLVGLSIAFAVVVICWVILWHNSSVLYPTVVHGNRTGNRVALTFDDGPHPKYTALTLDILAEHKTMATFFCLGYLVDKYPELARRMHDEGHLLGNHGFDHSMRDFFRPPGLSHQFIVRSASAIRDITGYFPRFYRPTIGIKTPPRVLSSYRLGTTCAGWSRRSADGGNHVLSHKKATKLAARTRAGDILLLHDGRVGIDGRIIENSDSHINQFDRGLRTLLQNLQNKGLEPVRLDQLLNLSPDLKDTPATAEGSSWRLIKYSLRGLLHEKTNPAWLCMSLGVGIVIGCSPVFGLHTFIAVVLALRLRLHKLAVLLGTNITNPLLAPFVIWSCLQTGWWILHGGALPLSLEALKSIGVAELLKHFLTCWMIGFPLVGMGLATIIGTTLYAALLLLKWTRSTLNGKSKKMSENTERPLPVVIFTYTVGYAGYYLFNGLFILLSFPLVLLLAPFPGVRYRVFLRVTHWFTHVLTRIYLPGLGVCHVDEISGTENCPTGTPVICADI